MEGNGWDACDIIGQHSQQLVLLFNYVYVVFTNLEKIPTLTG